jgi:hypothetical protein
MGFRVKVCLWMCKDVNKDYEFDSQRVIIIEDSD